MTFLAIQNLTKNLLLAKTMAWKEKKKQKTNLAKIKVLKFAPFCYELFQYLD